MKERIIKPKVQADPQFLAPRSLMEMISTIL